MQVVAKRMLMMNFRYYGSQAYKSGKEGSTSLKTFVKAEDIAMALFLASDQASRISGQVIAVDGHTENPDPKI